MSTGWSYHGASISRIDWFNSFKYSHGHEHRQAWSQTHTHTYRCTVVCGVHVCICMRVYIYIYTYTNIYIHTYFIHTYLYIYISTDVQTYISYIYIYTYTYTLVHIPTERSKDDARQAANVSVSQNDENLIGTACASSQQIIHFPVSWHSTTGRLCALAQCRSRQRSYQDGRFWEKAFRLLNGIGGACTLLKRHMHVHACCKPFAVQATLDQ